MKKLLLLTVACCVVFALGCSKKVEPAPAPAPAPAPVVEKSREVTPAPLSPRQIFDAEYAKLPTNYTVVKGNCLWWISEFKQIYNDPFMWPLIYKANKSKIKNPNRIYPGQNFAIARDFSLDDVKAARHKAGKSKKKSAPAKTANLPADIREALGYGF
jgi:LysM repeat protein